MKAFILTDCGTDMTGLAEIARQFRIESQPYGVEPFGRGHIHKTYLATAAIRDANRDDVPRYILQQINISVFQNVDLLMENILHITSHLQKKLDKLQGQHPDFETLQLIRAKTGALFHKDESGNYWRMFHFMAGTNNYDRPRDARQASEAGKVTGRFLTLLDDFPFKLHVVLPRFHDLSFRMEQFHGALDQDVAGRKKFIEREIDLAMTQLNRRQKLSGMMKDGSLPVRITHNDTKFNNILFDRHDRAICLIDLDTVMPGYVAYDFGDAIRTLANTAAEDEQDIDRIQFDISLFEAYARGFLAETKGFLTDKEKETLPEAPLLMTFMIGLRFLTDYMNGDVYYKTMYPEHNLIRARCQFRLLKEMEGGYGQIRNVIAV